jgi:hypothetical protein
MRASQRLAKFTFQRAIAHLCSTTFVSCRRNQPSDANGPRSFAPYPLGPCLLGPCLPGPCLLGPYLDSCPFDPCPHCGAVHRNDLPYEKRSFHLHENLHCPEPQRQAETRACRRGKQQRWSLFSSTSASQFQTSQSPGSRNSKVPQSIISSPRPKFDSLLSQTVTMVNPQNASPWPSMWRGRNWPKADAKVTPSDVCFRG